MLTGALVQLRAYEMDDLDRCCAWINDPEVTRDMAVDVTYPVSRAQEEAWLKEAMSQARPPKITYAIDTLADSRHIGTIDFRKIGGNARHAELGIMIGDKTCWDHGFGTDAIRTMLRFGFEELNLNRVYLTVSDDNARGIACYRKCGFTEEGRLRQDRFREGEYRDTIVMGVLREEFRGQT
jgi:RimJ/RimL family protein N-acetyltransferase